MFEGALFEWDDEKSHLNLVKHGIRFTDAVRVFAGSPVVARSSYEVEERWLATGSLQGREITVIFTWRGPVVRIISARRARRSERRIYDANDPR